MMIDRRDFIAGATLVAVAPALGLLPSQPPALAANVGPVVFMIEGWSVQDDNGTADQVWIRVGHSWRTAWR
jgi:hypothetical protein